MLFPHSFYAGERLPLEIVSTAAPRGAQAGEIMTGRLQGLDTVAYDEWTITRWGRISGIRTDWTTPPHSGRRK